MAMYKVTKKDGYYTYEAPGHFDCRLTRLHDPADVEGGRVINGLSHFLPGGGTEYLSNNMESIYYIIEGQMLFKGDDGEEFLLTKGDSVHIAPGCKKCVTNTGITSAQMLVVLVPAAQ
ncbi:MAG: cupin domain-containing protein [Agathobacter sp.]|nr:cupin domain-containing protein [Agathobacter sp.]